MPYNIGILSTGRDAAAQELLTQICDARSDLGFEIPYVFVNREKGESSETDKFLGLVNEFEVPIVTFSSKKYEPKLKDENKKQWREEYHNAVMQRLAPHRRPKQIDLAVGYMLIVGLGMAEKYNILNLHPALPDGPKGTWQEVVWELMEKGVLETGAHETGTMMHRLTKELDRGPPVTFCRVPITGIEIDGAISIDELWKNYRGLRNAFSPENIQKDFPSDAGNYPQNSHPLFVAIRELQFATEVPLLLHTIRLFSNGDLGFQKGELVAGDGTPLSGGYDITTLVNLSE